MITIAGLESETLHLVIEPLDLARMLDNILWPICKSMATKGLELVVDIPDTLPDIMADEQHLRIVVQQLLDNAATPMPVPSRCARREADAVRVDVIDTGHGIDADFSRHLFTRFARGSEGINSAERGIGLGLAIARELIERQGGRIWLEHTSGNGGSTFSFTLPCSQADPVSRSSSLATAAVAWRRLITLSLRGA